MTHKFLFCLVSSLLTITPTAFAQPPGEYRIINGKVDPGTYTGWKLFHTACYGCHGMDALGTDMAPNLVARIQNMTPRAFVTKVLTSYRIVLPDTDKNSPDSATSLDQSIDDVLRRDRQSRVRLLMPAWEDDANINPHVLDLFAYLNARAEGKLPPGKPKKSNGRPRKGTR
jgi:hypothetical protein